MKQTESLPAGYGQTTRLLSCGGALISRAKQIIETGARVHFLDENRLQKMRNAVLSIL